MQMFKKNFLYYVGIYELFLCQERSVAARRCACLYILCKLEQKTNHTCQPIILKSGINILTCLALTSHVSWWLLFQNTDIWESPPSHLDVLTAISISFYRCWWRKSTNVLIVQYLLRKNSVPMSFIDIFYSFIFILSFVYIVHSKQTAMTNRTKQS